MRRALLFSVVSFASLALGIACSSSSDTATPGGGGDDGSADGASSSGASGTSGSSGTSGASGTSGTDGSTPPFKCSTLTPAPKLCADFDDGMRPASSTTQTGAGASQAVVMTVSKSPPDSYETQVPAIPSQIAYSLLELAFTTSTTPTKFTVAFDFNPAADVASMGTLVIGRVFLSQTHAVSIEPTSENGAVIREQESPTPGAMPTLDHASTPFTPLPAANAWTRYELEVDLVGTQATNATLKIDGVVKATLALTGTSASDFFALNLGLQSDAAFTAHYDNLVVDY